MLCFVVFFIPFWVLISVLLKFVLAAAKAPADMDLDPDTWDNKTITSGLKNYLRLENNRLSLNSVVIIKSMCNNSSFVCLQVSGWTPVNLQTSQGLHHGSQWVLAAQTRSSERSKTEKGKLMFKALQMAFNELIIHNKMYVAFFRVGRSELQGLCGSLSRAQAAGEE